MPRMTPILWHKKTDPASHKAGCKEGAKFRVLVEILTKNGMNIWEARITARKLLDRKIPSK